MAKKKTTEEAPEAEEVVEAPYVSPDIAHRQKLEDDRAAGIDLPTGQRRDHPA